jgi:DNA-binding response OmpR family regulator
MAGGDGDRIVVIEDEAEHRMVLETWLRFEGYDVVCARSAEVGLVLIREQRPALVMLDLVLPGMSGFELLEEKAADPALADVGVVIISSRFHKGRSSSDEPGRHGGSGRPVCWNVS